DRASLNAADGAAPAVRFHDRVDDREAETDAARAARASRVGAGEALEDARVRLVGHADSLVGDLHRDLAPGGVARELDSVAGLAVLDGVLEQGVEGDPKLLRVGAERPVGQCAESPG